MLPTISSFFAAFYSYLSVYRPQLLYPQTKIPDTHIYDLKESYDFIIVGAGTSGAVVAGRLSENPTFSVLVIEAGGNTNPISLTPLVFRTRFNTEVDWNYTTTSQTRVCQNRPNNKCNFNMGRVLGGMTAIDLTWHSRGNRRDFDRWAEMGNKGWSYNNMLPYFKKLENCRIPSLKNSPYHGTNGPWSVQYPNYVTKLRDEYIRAGQEFGWTKRDENGEHQHGIDYSQLSMDGIVASNTGDAYLTPARKRKNLTIIKNSLVTKILINENNDLAVGVEYRRDQRIRMVKANREVILCAGAVNTPKLLILAGIGPREELKRINVIPRHILPVGKNFQDQLIIDLTFQINERLTITTDVWRTNESIAAYAIKGDGPLTTTGQEVSAYFNSINSKNTPNCVIQFHSFVPRAPGNTTQLKPLVTLRTSLLNVNTIGEVKLKSNNVDDDPLINPNFLADKSDYDAFENAIKIAIAFMKTPTMMKYMPRLSTDYIPQCEEENGRKLLRCLVRYGGSAFLHPTGTAKMGPTYDKNAVVTTEGLKVRGMKNLRVIDESVIPHSITGNSRITIIAMAERASDIIKNDHSNSQ